MARIISSEVPIGGVGYQYNVEGVKGVSAIITEYGPSIGAQGVVESILFAASLADDVFPEVQAETDIAYQRGYREGYDRMSRESIAGANEALEKAGVTVSGSLGVRIAHLARERDQLIEKLSNFGTG